MRTFCNCIALCRADVTPAASWFHTIPHMGEYPGCTVTYQGKQITDATLVFDRAAYDSIMAAFLADAATPGWRGLLVDREHFSLDSSKESDALAWAKEAREDESGIWTRWDFTPPGRRAWTNNILVSRSPVLKLQLISGKRFRPVRLNSIGMTNAPHFTELSTLAAARAAENQPGDPAQHTGDHTMNKLLALLGLPEDATEDQAVDALQALIDAKAEADTAVEVAEVAARSARCDAFIAAHKDRITDEAAFRLAYDAAPAATEAAFGLFRAAPPAGATRIIARAAATPGDGVVSLGAYRAMPPGSDKDAYLAKHKDALLRLERAASNN